MCCHLRMNEETEKVSFKNTFKTAEKSIDEICAKLQLHADSEQTLEELPTIEQKNYSSRLPAHVQQQSTVIEKDLHCLSEASVVSDDTEMLRSPERAPVSVMHEDDAREKDAESDKHDITNHGDVEIQPVVNDKVKVKSRHTSQYNSWHYIDMIKAIKAVQSKKLSMTAAAKKNGIPRTTLRHYLNDGTNKEAKRVCFSLSKKCEEDLVNFALKNRNLAERLLYKKIFDEAKLYSQRLCSEKGEIDRRISPTQAWIRRFVYRHKQLHDIFPSFLSKWDRPVHNGKIPNGIVETKEEVYKFVDLSVEEKESNSFLAYKNDIASIKDEEYRRKIDNSNDRKRNLRRTFDYQDTKQNDTILRTHNKKLSEAEHHEYNNSFHKIGMFDGQGQFKSRDMSMSYSTTNDEINNNNDLVSWLKSDDADRISSRCYFGSDDERMLPYKDLLSRVSKSRTDFNDLEYYDQNRAELARYDQVYDASRADDIRSNYSPNNSNDSNSQLCFNGAARSAGDQATRRNLIDQHFLNEPGINTPALSNTPPFINLSAVPLTQNKRPLSTLHEGRGNGVSNHNNQRLFGSEELFSRVNRSELNVMEMMLQAMENNLGEDFVQLFSERYRRNEGLERLYSKWVLLKTDIQLLDKN